MILDDIEVNERMESPANLLNRLRTSINHHKKEEIQIPSLPPKIDDLVENLEDKLGYSSLKVKASQIMSSAMKELEVRISEVTKPKELASIAEVMGKIITAQDKDKKDEDKRPVIHMYGPQFLNEEHFETIYVKE